MAELIDVTMENLDKEHICCAITDKKKETCVSSKKAWLSERFADGLVFKKLNERGKVFIEYLPAEKAWCPLDAEGYLHINCLWVAGQFKSQGWGGRLLDACIADARAQGKHGITALSSPKKKPFLSDPGFLKRRGFHVADTAPPWFELLHLPLSEDAPQPRFLPQAKEARVEEPGLVLYWCNQCPHTDKYVPLLRVWAEAQGLPVKLIKLESTEAARNAPTAWPTYSLFMDGRLVTNEILSESAFLKLLVNTQ